MLAQAIRTSIPAAPSIISMAGRARPITKCAKGTTRTPTPVLVCGDSRSMRAATASKSACACARDTPAFKRPTHAPRAIAALAQRIDAERNPIGHLVGGHAHGAGDIEREMEAARHHADDCVVLRALTSQANRAAHDGRVAGKPELPQIVAEKDPWSRPG